MRGLPLLLLVLLTAPVASAQYDEDEEPPKLQGTSRVSVMGGWRYAPNFKFYDTYYFQVENRSLARSRGSIGGPLLTATFAYSITEFMELGIDLFTTYERMKLTNKPGLNTVTYGAVVGLRFQKRLELGPQGTIASVGVLAGPSYSGAYFDGGRAVETSGTGLGLAAGATVRLSPRWGVCFELRQLVVGGEVEDIGKYNAGGTWLSVGMTYVLPWEPDHSIKGRL